jgi:hypothetical protein
MEVLLLSLGEAAGNSRTRGMVSPIIRRVLLSLGEAAGNSPRIHPWVGGATYPHRQESRQGRKKAPQYLMPHLRPPSRIRAGKCDPAPPAMLFRPYRDSVSLSVVPVLPHG